MEQSEFKYRLTESTKELIEFTQTLVVNSISTNVEYLIEPNSREVSTHLNEQELDKLNEINLLEGKPQFHKQVVDSLYDFGRVPLWVNAEIHYSTKRKTIIKLTCSRRFRNENDLNKIVNKFPPFSIKIPLPPWYIKGERFNINWKHQKLKRKWHALIWRWKYGKRLKT
ncbi:hypothetical protein [uncultured Winogradskyella sp.]|uniref:hypothetical protein n=1 Tax=Winogradskyella sp. 4-2091 TaxID=3381659 RepID=UPI0026359391|nr:hypothetical protein [uncultured Winogradskyella sp.]